MLTLAPMGAGGAGTGRLISVECDDIDVVLAALDLEGFGLLGIWDIGGFWVVGLIGSAKNLEVFNVLKVDDALAQAVVDAN